MQNRNNGPKTGRGVIAQAPQNAWLTDLLPYFVQQQYFKRGTLSKVTAINVGTEGGKKRVIVTIGHTREEKWLLEDVVEDVMGDGKKTGGWKQSKVIVPISAPATLDQAQANQDKSMLEDYSNNGEQKAATAAA